MKLETIAIHGGFDCDPTTKAVAVPIYQTAAYAFDSAEHGAALFNLEVDGYRYTRIGNPTNAVLEQRVAELEGGVGALSVSSGQTALYYAALNLTEMGRNIISVPQLYGTTYTLFAHILPKLGVQVRFAKTDSAADLEALIDDDTRAIFCESVGNPAGNICDVEAIAAVAHRHHMPLIVDNTVATPMLLRPVDYGADVIVHSLTKFMGGHGTTLGGIVVDGGRFPWTQHAARYPMFTTPDDSYHGLVYTEHYGAAAFIGRCRSVYQRAMGAVLAPMNAFLLLQGIETLALRMDRHVENARRVGEFLAGDARVESVNFAGLAGNRYHSMVHKYLGGRACSLMTFDIRGGLAAGIRFYNALKLFKRLVNLGDAKSLACHPASTTHRQMSAAEQRAAGVGPGSIRLSVGIEHIDDILADLAQALAAAVEAPSGATLAPGPLAAAVEAPSGATLAPGPLAAAVEAPSGATLAPG
jgi:O-acetylhomoserine (thiol)-lyase